MALGPKFNEKYQEEVRADFFINVPGGEDILERFRINQIGESEWEGRRAFRIGSK